MKRFSNPDPPLTPEQFRQALTTIGMNSCAFSRWIGVNDRTVRHWRSGRYPVPLPVGYLLQLMVLTDTKPGDS